MNLNRQEFFRSPNSIGSNASNESISKFKIGDTFINPATGQPVKITFLGNKVCRFFLKNVDKEKQVFYEAIEGSEQYNQLQNDPRFEGEIVSTTIPSVELEWITDIENRRIVVSEEVMKEFKPPKEVSQINSKTGMSMNYFSQNLTGIASCYIAGMDELKTFLKESPQHVKKYEEFFSGYANVVTDKNRDSIKKLDKLIEDFNKILSDPENINEEDFRKTYKELYFVVYGDEENII